MEWASWCVSRFFKIQSHVFEDRLSALHVVRPTSLNRSLGRVGLDCLREIGLNCGQFRFPSGQECTLPKEGPADC